MKKIAILGSTGSIGKQTLDVISRHEDSFELVAMAAGYNIELVIDQIMKYHPAYVSVATEAIAQQVRRQISPDVQIGVGMTGLIQVATWKDSDILVSALVGSVGLRPTLAAIQAGKTIALANKETLVTAGELVMEAVRKHKGTLLPVDSEHSAILQCLQGEKRDQVKKIILTASGGSFRHKTREELVDVSIEQALNHPNWSMGNKITIDSATMMNKGLEVIEARWLFDVTFDQIDVLVHQESMVHSLVLFQDGSLMAQLGTPDMRVPIQYALSYPDRLLLDTDKLDLAQVGQLNFKAIDFERYPCVQLAYAAGRKGGTYPTVLNAANEVAVDMFLKEQISFIHIEQVIEETLSKHEAISAPTLEHIEEADQWARRIAQTIKGR